MVTGQEASSTTQNEVEGLSDQQHDLLTNENLPKIRTLARLVATNSSSALLAAWGIINLIGWWAAFADNTKLLRNIPDAESWIWLFLYSGLAIGCAMLLFAAIGALARSASTITLNGLSLILVGSWNVLSSAVLESQLSSAGYTSGGLDNLYGLLGICQIIWGGVRLRSAIRVSRWRCSTLSRRELTELRTRLENFVRKDEGKNPRSQGDHFGNWRFRVLQKQNNLPRPTFRGRCDLRLRHSKRLLCDPSGVHPESRLFREQAQGFGRRWNKSPLHLAGVNVCFSPLGTSRLPRHLRTCLFWNSSGRGNLE
jgi:hypothetical protein